VVTARLPSGFDPNAKLERGGSTAEDSVYHALNAVRDGRKPTMAIKDFVTKALKEENKKLREDFEAIQEEHKATVKQCQSLLKERVKMGKQ